jgi:hypothetical protein
VGGRRPKRPGPSPTLGSLGPSHQWCHKSRVSLRGPPCAHGVAGTPHGEVRDTRADFEKQLSINAQRGFPGMFASLDCMHYLWKNCPVAWQGDFGDRDGKNSIILEAIADQSLHI